MRPTDINQEPGSIATPFPSGLAKTKKEPDPLKDQALSLFSPARTILCFLRVMIQPLIRLWIWASLTL